MSEKLFSYGIIYNQIITRILDYFYKTHIIVVLSLMTIQ